ncbi:MAG: hypothetical protein AUJ08_03890 [Thaumarchaeota archaeon 13_1_40CM_3_50_5]|nr:MAG: hypothetical protein AUJ08_03890 [Thaumarchaeota archaeon 13_1_40CM_3_50_5]
MPESHAEASEMVSVDVLLPPCDGVTLEGLKLNLRLESSEDAVRATALENWLRLDTVIVEVTDEEGLKETDPGLAATVKSGYLTV